MELYLLVTGAVFVAYLFGYFVGCHHVVSDIRRMTKQLEQEANNDLSKMQHKSTDC